MDGIDYFMVDIYRKMHLIDAEVEALTKEIQRLKTRRRATNSLKDYFNKTLIPMVVEELGDDNGVYETDTARYKLYETFGPVAVVDEDNCTGCQACVPFCPVDCIEPVASDKYEFPIIPPVQVRFNECTGCQVCARVCTKMTWDAIRMLGTETFEDNYSLEID